MAKLRPKPSHRRVQWRALGPRTDTGVVSRPAPPVLTIRHNGSQQSFAPGHEVVIGRDLYADLRIADPRISRAHLILRFDQGRWKAIDNGSLNGTYVNGYRMPVFDVHDGQSVNVGNPQGPRLTFQIGAQQPTVRPAQMRATQDSGPPTLAWSTTPGRPEPPQRPAPPRQARDQTPRPARARTGPVPAPPRPSGPPRPRPYQHKAAAPVPSGPPPRPPSPAKPPPKPPPEERTVVNAGSSTEPPAESTVIGAKPGDVSNLATRFVKFLSQRPAGAAAPAGAPAAAGTVTIGRANENDIVIPDVLASREHATLTLTPLGTEIRDRSINGTFVNGIRVGSAILTEGDVVTIGNVDLVFNNSTLVPRKEAETRTGGLEVHGVKYTVGDGKQANSSWMTSR